MVRLVLLTFALFIASALTEDVARQLPTMQLPAMIPPRVNTGLIWDDDAPMDMVSKDELEERDRENQAVTDEPEAVATDLPASITAAVITDEPEGTTTSSDISESEEEEVSSEPEEETEEEQVVEEEVIEEQVVEQPAAVHPCVRCIERMKLLIHALGVKAAALP